MKNALLLSLILFACAPGRSEAPATRPSSELPPALPVSPAPRDVPAVTGVAVPPVSHRTALRLRFDGPPTQAVRVGMQVDLYRLTFQAERSIELRLPPFLLEALVSNDRLGCLVNDAGRPNFVDLRLDDLRTGALLAGPASLRPTAGSPRQPVTFPSDVLMMRAGEERTLAFRATTVDQDETGCAFTNQRFVVTAGSDGRLFRPGDVRVLDEDRAATAEEIDGDVEIPGNPVTVIRPELRIALSSAVMSSTGVKNQGDVPAVAITLTANGASDVLVRGLSPVGVGDIGLGRRRGNFQDVAVACALYDGMRQVGSPRVPNPEGRLLYQNLNYVVTRGTTRTLIAICSHDSVVAQDNGDRYSLGFPGPEGVDAVDTDNRRVRVTVSPELTRQLTDPAVEVTVRRSGTFTLVPLPSGGRTVTGGDVWQVVAEYRALAIHEPSAIERLAITWDNREGGCLDAVAIASDRVIQNWAYAPATGTNADIELDARPIVVVNRPVDLQVLARFHEPRPGTRCEPGTTYAFGLAAGLTDGEWDTTPVGSLNVRWIGLVSGARVHLPGPIAGGRPVTVVER